MPKPLSTNCGKFWKRWEYQTTWPASWEICKQVRKQQLELDMEQQTGSKSVKEYIKAVYCHPACLIYMLSTSWEMLGWMKHKLESRLLGEISITSDMQMTPPELKCTEAGGKEIRSGDVEGLAETWVPQARMSKGQKAFLESGTRQM